MMPHRRKLILQLLKGNDVNPGNEMADLLRAVIQLVRECPGIWRYELYQVLATMFPTAFSQLNRGGRTGALV
ncbi:hypothetical protein AFL94_17715 [Arthrobacter sp. LS16]|nr:hypothetical protein AFL94_17715 [Arthrobacter sp. LS16]